MLKVICPNAPRCTCRHCRDCGKCYGKHGCPWHENCVCRTKVGLCLCCTTSGCCDKCNDSYKESCLLKDKCKCDYYCEDCNDTHSK